MAADISPVNNTVPKQSESGFAGLLSKDAFLQILVAQLSHPDPFAPQDPSAFINEMSQMSMLEQLLNLSNRMEAVYRLEALNQAASLIGHEVVVADGGETVTGNVAKVVLGQETVTLVIDGKPYDVGMLLEVR
ncbi:MAG: flagellar hook capping FlgD N-terminal domain-containing protein [Bacillota bacterium]